MAKNEKNNKRHKCEPEAEAAVVVPAGCWIASVGPT